MLRQEQYHKLADTFGTGIGIAEWEGDFYPHYTNVSKMPNEYKVIALTNFMIKENIYQQVMREVIRMEAKYKNKRINKSTIYEKSINNFIEQNEIHSLI
jgi:hypothetical protein